jgi:hypothetical protein
MSLIWDTGDEPDTELAFDELLAKLRENEDRERELRYQATKVWIASMLVIVPLAGYAAYAFLQYPWP